MMTPRRRSEAEVVMRLRQNHDDFLGFKREVLADHLSVEALREFATKDSDLSDWRPRSLDLEPVMTELGDYMEFAWGKVADHRGISANRSVDKVGEYVWLLGLDDLLAEMEAADYPQYGAPKLAVVCQALMLVIPDDEGIQRMIQGLPCEPGCDEGCG
jgi:hypothetical protein